jgi:hypothetical protein
MTRYVMRRREHPNEWAVVDTTTGEIAREKEILLAGLSQIQATEAAERLNELERRTLAASR